MDWIRENKPLAAILGVILVGSLALGYLLFDAWSVYTEAKDGYLSLGNQVAGLKGARLAPTEANLKAKQALVEEYAGLVNTLGRTLLILQDQTKGPPVNDIEFQDKLKAKISDVRKAVQSRMQIPAEFAFGFDEYTRTLPKSAAAAAELSGYLDAMDELVKLFLKCDVKAVDSLERSKLPIEEQAAAPQQGNNNAGMQAQATAGITEKRNISVVLTLDQGALQLLVARLSSPSEMPFFTSLRLLRIENQSQDGPLHSDVKIAPRGKIIGDGNTNQGDAKEVPSDEIRPPDPAPPDAVSVFGNESLKVRMEIDLVKFLDAARGVALQSPAGR